MQEDSHNLNSRQRKAKDTKKTSTNQSISTSEFKTFSSRSLGILSAAKALKIDVNEDLQPPQIALQLLNSKTGGFDTIGTLGNFSLLTGKAKSRKTFLVGIAVAAESSKNLILERFKGNLPPKQKQVLYIDTEQGKYHVQQALKRICRLIDINKPSNLHVYYLRSLQPSERLEMIEVLIYDNDNIGFVVIDGIKDLITSINDEEQATMLASKLLKWSEERNIHILTVLHQNKSDNNARGHLGTELINKAETVLSITKSVGNNAISFVEAQQCRNIEPDNFAFEIIDDLPTSITDFEIAPATKKSQFDILSLGDDKIYQLLVEVFAKKDSFYYGELIEEMRLSYPKFFKITLGANLTKMLCKHCKTKGWLVQDEPKKPYILGAFQNNHLA